MRQQSFDSLVLISLMALLHLLNEFVFQAITASYKGQCFAVEGCCSAFFNGYVMFFFLGQEEDKTRAQEFKRQDTEGNLGKDRSNWL